ncbi:unnamed protein product, partial [Sphacelaria rigidula]
SGRRGGPRGLHHEDVEEEAAFHGSRSHDSQLSSRRDPKAEDDIPGWHGVRARVQERRRYVLHRAVPHEEGTQERGGP